MENETDELVTRVGGIDVQVFKGSVIVTVSGEAGLPVLVDAYPPEMADKLAALITAQTERARRGESDRLSNEQLAILDGNEVGDLTTGKINDDDYTYGTISNGRYLPNLS